MIDPPSRSVAVVFGEGAAAPREIVSSLPRELTLTWIVRTSDQLSARLLPVLAGSGPVVQVDDELNPSRPLGDVHGITTFCEGLIRPTAQLAPRLGLRYHDHEAARALTNKAVQRARLSESGVDAVRYEVVTSADGLAAALGKVGFDAVLKPVESSGSRYTYPVTDELSADVARDSVPDSAWRAGMILEERLHGTGTGPSSGLADYVSVEVCTFMGRHEVVAIVGRLPLAEPFRERGAVFPAVLEPSLAEAIRHTTVAALSSLGVIEGWTHTEVKLTSEGPRVIEINGRLGGHVNYVIKRTGGPDLIEAGLRAAAGSAPRFSRWVPSGCAFRYLVPAPPTPGRVQRLDGIGEVRRLAGVEMVSVRARVGTWCDWRDGTGSYIAQVQGWVPDSAKLADLISRIDQTVTVVLA